MGLINYNNFFGTIIEIQHNFLKNQIYSCCLLKKVKTKRMFQKMFNTAVQRATRKKTLISFNKTFTRPSRGGLRARVILQEVQRIQRRFGIPKVPEISPVPAISKP